MDQCPKCGAAVVSEIDDQLQFKCSSLAPKIGWFQQSIACKDRQIAALEERLADLTSEYNLELEGNRELFKELAECRERLAAWREWHKERVKPWNQRGDDKAYWKAFNRLQTLGEL